MLEVVLPCRQKKILVTGFYKAPSVDSVREFYDLRLKYMLNLSFQIRLTITRTFNQSARSPLTFQAGFRKP